MVPTRVLPPNPAAANAASFAKVVHIDGIVIRADLDNTANDLYAEFESDVNCNRLVKRKYFFMPQ